MSGRRALLWTAGAGVAAVAVCLLVLLASLDGIVRRAIETRGTALTDTAVRVADVAIAVGEGRMTIRGLQVANPPGYAAPEVFVLEEATVAVSLTSLLGDPIHIHAVRVRGPQVFYEVDAAGRANVDVIRKAMKQRRRADAPRRAGTPGPRSKREADGGGRRFIIDVLELKNGTVNVDTRADGGTQRVETLEGFELTGIGAAEGGVGADAVALQVAGGVVQSVAISLAAGELEKFLGKQLGGTAGDLLKKGGSGAIGKGIGTVLEDLFKKKERDR